MKVLSLNANKGLIKHMDDLLDADVVLSQEPYPHAEDRSEDALLLFPDYHSTATRYLLTLSKEPHDVLHLSEYLILTEHVDGSVLGNVYIHPGKDGGHRAAQLERIVKYLERDVCRIDLFAGDWNMAPSKDDGWNGEKHSTYTTKLERSLLQQILKLTGLQDLGSLIDWSSTIEKKNRGKIISFRCDLALANPENWSLTYNHGTRKGSGPADHSMLVLRRNN
jgi:hypothetical protein